VGNYNHDKVPARPRMHHKFLVFCRVQTGRIPLRAGRELRDTDTWEREPFDASPFNMIIFAQ